MPAARACAGPTGCGRDGERDCPCADPTCLGGRAAGRRRDMEDDQLEQFGEAVEKKKRAAKEASEQPGQTPRGSAVDGDQGALTPPARTQDEYDERARGPRHGKVTADKWNQ